MKAVAIRQPGRELCLLDIDLPEIKPDEVLVKTIATGVCSTDRELLTYLDLVPPPGASFLVIGHEAVGRVAQVGAAVSQVATGDLVVPTVRRGCRRCPFCKAGRSDLCRTGRYTERGILGLHGFMSEFFVEKETNVVKIPPELGELAVLLEPLSVGLKAIIESLKVQEARLGRAAAAAGHAMFSSALIVGGGSLGLLSSLVLLQHSTQATVVDLDETNGVKASVARALGARYIRLDDYRRGIEVDCGRLRRDGGAMDCDLLIDTSGDPATYSQLSELVAPNGIIVLLGLPDGHKHRRVGIHHFITSLVMQNKVILGSVNASREHFERGIPYLAPPRRKFEDTVGALITHTLPFARYREAFDIGPRDRVKVVLDWR